MWENSYYIGGSDDGVLTTPAGPVGAALCWELIRAQTVRRLLSKVNFVVAGSCWRDLQLPVPPQLADYQARLRNFVRQAPGDLARRLGVPVGARRAGWRIRRRDTRQRDRAVRFPTASPAWTP
jgi:hypothetical protein